jgi:maltooligosyltrehalose trehalohydrolase
MKNFRVWAPEKKEMILHIVAPFDKEIPMLKDEWGYFTTEADVPENTRYFFKPDGENNFPDPQSSTMRPSHGMITHGKGTRCRT